MSITTNAQLETAVANWLHRVDLTAIIPDLVMLGEKKIFREVRCRAMEAALAQQTSSGVVTVPANYLELKFVYVLGTPNTPLKRMSLSQLHTEYPLRSASGKPTAIAREGSNFIFGPFPSEDYIIGGVYYARPTSIATVANTLFTENPDLYLFAALSEAGDYVQNDKSLVKWTAKYAEIVKILNNESSDETGSGGGMQVRTA